MNARGGLILLALLILLSQGVFSQQLKLGKNPSIVAKSAVLELESDNQGLLFTRISDTYLINAMSPPNGMVIFHTLTNQLLLRSQGYWQPLTRNSMLGDYWKLNGNSNGAANTLGKIDNFNLVSLPTTLSGSYRSRRQYWYWDRGDSSRQQARNQGCGSKHRFRPSAYGFGNCDSRCCFNKTFINKSRW